MSNGSQQQGTGRARHALVVACALLVACGLALIGWVATHQVTAPQAQLVSAARADREAGHPGRGADGAGGPGPAHGATGAPTKPSPSPSATPAATPGHPPALGRSRPVRVDIPAIGVDSRLQRLGTNPDGTVQVPAPPRYNEAGWFTGSPTPGQLGPAVILGHIDGVGTTPSVFFRLGAVRVGEQVEVTRADGRTLTFTVYRVQRYAKNDFPTALVYGNTAGPELRLITCGGTVNPHTGHYRDNTVVYAHLTGVHSG